MCEDKLVIVTDSTYVNIYSKDFNRIAEPFKMKGDNPIPRGVAINREDIFIADKSICHIMKYTMDGNLECESDKSYKDCYGITIYDKKLYVAHDDQEPHCQGKIQVLDLNLNHLFSIFESLDAPRDVAIASNNAFFVSEYNNNCFKVFKGEIIEEFGRKKVEHPTKICIYEEENKEYVLVASHYKSCVDVFTSSGELVESIGNEKIGRVRDLYGLCVDSDGNVYIAAYGGNLVKKFKLQDYI